jgi:SAM-dependent methyltransferase
MTKVFDAYSAYYDVLYQDKSYSNEAKYVLNHLNCLSANGSILELGSGTGMHASFFCNSHHLVTGIEQSPSMVEKARERNITNYTPLCGDIRGFDLDREFDVAVSLFHVISYLQTNEDILACFNQVRKHLRPGGQFIFDVWYSPAVYAQKPAKRTKQMENAAVKVTRKATPVMRFNENIVDVIFDVEVLNKKDESLHTLTETHSMRHFSIPEMQMFAQCCGFHLEIAEEFLTGNLPSVDTWGVCFVFKKV